MMAISLVYTQISSFGLVTTIARFFPFFKTEDKRHKGFVLYVILISAASFLIVTILYIVFRPVIMDAFKERSALFLEYFYALIPLSLFLILLTICESILRSIYKTVFPVFVREILFRVLTTAGIGLYFFKILTFENFVLYFILIQGFLVLLLLIQIQLSKEFKLRVSLKEITRIRGEKYLNLEDFLFLRVLHICWQRILIR